MAPLYTKGKKEILFLTTLWNGGELVSRTVDSSDGVHIHTFYLHMFNKYVDVDTALEYAIIMWAKIINVANREVLK